MTTTSPYRTSSTEGGVWVNGRLRNHRRFRKMSCYIMQDDQLLAHISVMEAMQCATDLKLSEATSKEDKHNLVSEWGRESDRMWVNLGCAWV